MRMCRSDTWASLRYVERINPSHVPNVRIAFLCSVFSFFNDKSDVVCSKIITLFSMIITKSSTIMDLKRKRLFYSSNDDIILLREISGHNPYEDPNRWSLIEKNVRETTCKNFSKRSMQDRAKNLLQKFEEKHKEDIFKSGVEEEVTEQDDLLHSILNMMKEFHNKKKLTPYQIGSEKRENAVQQIAANIGSHEEILNNSNFEMNDAEYPEEYITIIQDNDQEQSPTIIDNDQESQEVENIEPLFIAKPEGERIARGRGRSKSSRTGVHARIRNNLKYSSIRFLEKKNDRWYEIRKRELDLEEQKFMLQKKETEKKLEIMEKRHSTDLKIITNQLTLIENQQKLIEIGIKAIQQF